MRRLILAALLLCLSACNTAAPAGDSLDAIARDYVQLSLTIGEKEEGYIDAYYGPEELQARAEAEAPGLTLEQLSERTQQLRSRAAQFEDAGDEMAARRARFLVAQLTAAATRLRMMQGEKLSFEDEAEGLFGVRPEVQPLESFEPVIARIERLVPGEAPLPERIEAFSSRFDVPKERLKPVFDAAIAECRRRTLEHIQLPPGERFDLAFVTGKSWSGYNYYQGNAHSRIEINTDLPIRISRAVDLGCHEGYPGHHVLNALLEQRLVKERGWVELSVYPLYSPQSLIAEGSANYGVDLAFPGKEQIEFEKRVLYPLAALPAAEAESYARLQEALEQLSGARFTITKQLLEGTIDDAEAVRLTQRYQLALEERARQSVEFIKDYRSYVINYGLGEDMVRADVEAAGATPEARWARMEQLLSEPTLPRDLRRGR
jgi:hypothetical protein